jgi:hypothetical protein
MGFNLITNILNPSILPSHFRNAVPLDPIWKFLIVFVYLWVYIKKPPYYMAAKKKSTAVKTPEPNFNPRHPYPRIDLKMPKSHKAAIEKMASESNSRRSDFLFKETINVMKELSKHPILPQPPKRKRASTKVTKKRVEFSVPKHLSSLKKLAKKAGYEDNLGPFVLDYVVKPLLEKK